MTDLTNFDPIKIGDEIAMLESEAQSKLTEAKGEFVTRSAKIAAILWNVKQHHPEHLKAICERAGIGRSRRKQLLQIGSGTKTLEKSRAENNTRVQRHRAKAGAITVMAPPAEARADTQPSACGPEDPKTTDGTEEIELGKVIARLRRDQPRNADTMRICDALERRLKRP
jgi:hypothetical protein